MALHNPGVSTVAIASVTTSTATAEVDEVSVEEPVMQNRERALRHTLPLKIRTASGK